MINDSSNQKPISRRELVKKSVAAGLAIAAGSTAYTSGQTRSTTSNSMNYVERWLNELGQPSLPVPGFEVNASRTAVLITDPQNDFLHPDGVAWGAVGESVKENDTVANIGRLMEVAVNTGMTLVVSPHYYYPTDHGWKFEGTLEKLMHNINMFDRKGTLNLEGFEGSGADWLNEYKPFINDRNTIVCNPHKVYGPENNDVVLQLQKQGIEKVLVAGMSANLCVESHLRELLERGFECAVVADATAAAKLPGLDGMTAALVNYTMLSSEVITTKEAVKRIKATS